jgi:hypothetical protein
VRYGPLLYCICGAMLENQSRELEPGVRSIVLPKCPYCKNERIFRHVDNFVWKLTDWDREFLEEHGIAPR